MHSIKFAFSNLMYHAWYRCELDAASSPIVVVGDEFFFFFFCLSFSSPSLAHWPEKWLACFTQPRNTTSSKTLEETNHKKTAPFDKLQPTCCMKNI